jgi:hypothetical protein
MGSKHDIEREFEEVDPYNPQNTLKGIIYRTNDRYGSLLIKEVNGRPREQYINTTPKFYYPGGTQSYRSYKRGLFPEFTFIRCYDKLDGTNVFAFRYTDADGNRFISYKTRLTPFLKKNGFKDWIFLWEKMLEKYHDEIEIIKTQLLHDDVVSGFAFEMYGSANKILIEYPAVLDTRLLYWIDINGGIHAPIGFSFPTPDVIAKIKQGSDPDDVYEKMVDDCEQLFKSNRSVEGRIFYIETEEGTIAWKCKPPSVLAEQGEGTKYVSYREAYVTCLNVVESLSDTDQLAVETYELLAETYDDTIIELSKEKIDKAINDARNYILFRKEVVEYFKGLDLEYKSVVKNSPKIVKDVTMRAMMKKYNGKKSTEVFNALTDHFSLHNEK